MEKRPILHHYTKFYEDRWNSCWDITILWFFKTAAAAILDFQKFIQNFSGWSAVRVMCHHAKFHRNRSSWRYGDLTFFTARRYASVVYAMTLCICLSVSGTSRCSTKTARRQIRPTVTHSSAGTLVTPRCYASAVLAMGLCLCLSVTSRSSAKTAKHRITQTTPHDSAVTLVFCRQRSPRNSTGVTPYEGAKCRWGGSKSATFDK